LIKKPGGKIPAPGNFPPLGNADRYLPSVSNIIANLFKQALEGRFEAALTFALAAKPKALHGLKVINTQLILKANGLCKFRISIS
jgi:hypothetical protein